MKTLTFTGAQFIEAIEKNGYPKGTGTFFSFNHASQSYEYCALGQAYKNLGVEIEKNNEWGWEILDQLKSKYQISLGDIWIDNDDFGYDKAVETARRIFAPHMDTVFTVEYGLPTIV